MIQTVCFDTQTTSEEVANAFSDKVKTLDCEALLSKALSRYDHIPGTIRLDSLTIDIGNIRLDEFDLLEAEILTRIEDLFSHILPQTESLSGRAARFEDVSPPATLDALEMKLQMLIYYLVTGALPWNSMDKPDIESVFLEIMREVSASRLRALFIPELRKRSVIRRMSVVFQTDTIETFVTRILETPMPKAIETIAKALKRHINPAPGFKSALNTVYLTVLVESYRREKDYAHLFVDMSMVLLRDLSPVTLLSVVHEIDRIMIASPEGAEIVAFKDLVESLRGENSIQNTSHETAIHQQPEIKQSDENTITQKKGEEEICTQESADEDEAGDTPAGKEQYFIDNAGLVLLNAALLQKHFEEFNWVKEKQIADDRARDKIMLWLDYLVWGEHKVHEYGLALNKILTGMLPADICDMDIALSRQEKEAADTYLQTLIAHWTMLKNTGIEGLRQTFLQRAGRLSNEDGGWQLHVESKGYDILIDSLPWSYSIIKFSWMTKPLFTQWQTKI